MTEDAIRAAISRWERERLRTKEPEALSMIAEIVAELRKLLK